MNHSFLCVVGCDVYPRLAHMSYMFPFRDFARFLVMPAADQFEEFTYSEATG